MDFSNGMELMTAHELAKALKVKLVTIRSWTSQGAPYIACGRLRRYRLPSVLEWLQGREEERQARRRAKGEGVAVNV